ncbi:MAG: LuxR C-terminal-related transcriptional regulator [Candidatus Promineifilaceae bacterium]|nr:LuxR C-terminal-related transcriptional regulator [Candidatus Promineifilaceae bacterium]
MKTGNFGGELHPPLLTVREQEVLAYMAEGLTNREIGARMVVAQSTVKWYVRQIFNKLAVDSRQGAVERARALDALAPDREEIRPPGNLPTPLSSFVGRAKEIAEIKQLLKISRLVTLSGAAGSGKTRLALRVAALLALDYPDGVHYISLAGTRDALLVPSAIAHVLGISEQPDRPLMRTLQRNLAHKKMLLILDNFEHLPAAAPLVSELLVNAPRLTILVTGREALHVSGEYDYRVPPLALPAAAGEPSIAELLNVESVALFVQRARMVSRDFRLTEENAAAVTGICLRLDGLPLAIELAAPRIKLFSPKRILARLDSRLELLIRGPRDLPTRQRTLRATLDWSYNLLEQGEQRLFSYLSVFQGGRTIEALQAVCGLNIQSPLPSSPQHDNEPISPEGDEILAGLESLLNKNQLYQKEGTDGELRFYMLETVHEYARERLQERGEQTLMQDRHLDYYLQLGELFAYGYLRHGQLALFQQTEAEMANIRVAYAWARQCGQIEKGARLITAVNYYLRYATNRVVEGYRLARSLLPHVAQISPRYRVSFLCGVAELAFQNNDIVRARRWAQRAQNLARELDDKQLLAWSLVLNVAFGRDDPHYELTITNGHAAEALFRELNDRPGLAYALNRLGEIYRLGGELTSARQNYEEGLAICRETGEVIREHFLYNNLGLIAFAEGDYERSRDLLLRALGRNELLGWVHWTFTVLRELAGPLAMLGEAEKAARISGACARLTAVLGVSFHPFDQSTIARFEAELQELLDEETYTTAWADGQRMTYEELLAYALSEDGKLTHQT